MKTLKLNASLKQNLIVAALAGSLLAGPVYAQDVAIIETAMVGLAAIAVSIFTAIGGFYVARMVAAKTADMFRGRSS